MFEPDFQQKLAEVAEWKRSKESKAHEYAQRRKLEGPPIDKLVSRVVNKKIRINDPKLAVWVKERKMQKLPTNPDVSSEAARSLQDLYK